MRIDGAGGCFDNRLYEVDIDVAWNIALLCVNEMGVTIDEQDDAAHQLHFHNKKKIMQLAMQSLDEETVQVIMDSTKERLQIYNWNREDKAGKQIYELFEKKLTEYRAFILCPNCSAKIEKEVGELDGVQSSVVNLMKQTLTINVAPVAANTIASQIETIVHSHEPDVEVSEIAQEYYIPAKKQDTNTSYNNEDKK